MDISAFPKITIPTHAGQCDADHGVAELTEALWRVDGDKLRCVKARRKSVPQAFDVTNQ
jgi:hypothetical protein